MHTYTQTTYEPKCKHRVAQRVKVNLTCMFCQFGKIPENTNPEIPQNRRIELSPMPIDAESRAVSKKVLTLAVAQKEKKLERFEFFSGRLSKNTDPYIG